MPFNLPETMISMAAIAVGFTVFVEHLDNSRSETTAYDTSTVILEFLDAAQAYAAQRHVPLNVAIAGAGEQPALVTRSALVGSGYLAPSFPTTTSFGATLSAYVRRNPSADPAGLRVACSTYSSSQGTCPLEVMVVTAGGIVPRADVRGAVMRFGETKIGEVGASNVARGPNWSASLGPFQIGSAGFQAGQLVARASVPAIQATPWIARTTIDGHPELARMSTTLSFENGAGANLDLNGNNVVDGNEVYANAFYYSSDCRLKEAIRQVSAEEARAIVGRIGLYRFRYRGEARERIGVVAQNVAEAAPEVVRTGPDGMLRVDYAQLSTILIAAIQSDRKDQAGTEVQWECSDREHLAE